MLAFRAQIAGRQRAQARIPAAHCKLNPASNANRVPFISELCALLKRDIGGLGNLEHPVHERPGTPE